MTHKKDRNIYSSARPFSVGILLGGLAALLFYLVWIIIFRTAFF